MCLRWVCSRSTLAGARIRGSQPCFHLLKRLGPGSGGRRGVGREERPLGLFVADLFEGMVLAYSPGADGGGTRIDGLEQPLQIRKGGEWILLALAHPGGAVEPAPGRDVGDRIGVADDVVAALQMVVQHLVMALGLPAIAID